MLRVFDHAGLGECSRYRAPHVAFRDSEHVGVRKYQAFAARWLAYALPCQRFASILADELSPNLGDGLRDQAAAVWDCEDAGLAATSIPSVNLIP